MAASGAFGQQEQLQQLRELRELEASNAALSLQVETLERRQIASRGRSWAPAQGGQWRGAGARTAASTRGSAPSA